MADAAPMPDWQDIETALAPLQLAISAAELHGSLAGWLAGGGRLGGGWLGKVLADDSLPQRADARLEALAEATQSGLEDAALGFRLLLPPEDATVNVRANALFDWCRAFLGAFGLAAGAAPGLSDESREALEDLARLAMSEADSDDEDEDALAELEEFVRVAALLLHGDCALAEHTPATLH